MEKWEIRATPSADDPDRHLLLLLGGPSDVSALLKKFGSLMGRPLPAQMEGFNLKLVLHRLKPEVRAKLDAWLRHVAPPPEPEPAAEPPKPAPALEPPPSPALAPPALTPPVLTPPTLTPPPTPMPVLAPSPVEPPSAPALQPPEPEKPELVSLSPAPVPVPASPPPVPMPAPVVAPEPVAAPKPAAAASVPPPSRLSEFPLTVELRRDWTLETLTVGAYNRFAHAAAMSVISSPGTMYNPLFLYGVPGTGKSHMLGAIGDALSKGLGGAGLLVTSGSRLSRAVNAGLARKSMAEVDAKVAESKALLIDDIHLIALSDQNGEALAKIFKTFFERQQQIVITSLYPPRALAALEEALKFSFSKGWSVDLKIPSPAIQKELIGAAADRLGAGFGSEEIGLLHEKLAQWGYSDLTLWLKRASTLKRMREASGEPALLQNLLPLIYEPVADEPNNPPKIAPKSFTPPPAPAGAEPMAVITPKGADGLGAYVAASFYDVGAKNGFKQIYRHALWETYDPTVPFGVPFLIGEMCHRAGVTRALIVGPAPESPLGPRSAEFAHATRRILESFDVEMAWIPYVGLARGAHYLNAHLDFARPPPQVMDAHGSLAPLAAGALLAAVSAAAAWWAFVFRFRLPLERALRAKESELEAVRRLAERLFDASTLARRPDQAPAEAAGRALDALHGQHSSLALAVVARRPDGSAALLAHRGGAWARVPLPSLRLDAGFLARAAADGRAEWILDRTGGVADDPLAAALAGLGFVAAAAHGWSGEDGAGALVAARSEPGEALARAEGDLALAAAALRSAAALAAGVARLSETRERLQGGLSAAMQELTSTHDRLIRKSREVKTLHDVAQAMVTRVGRDITSLGAIVAIVARALEADLVAFLILDETTGELATQPGAFGLEGEDPLYRIPLTDERSSSVRVFKTRVPFMSGDAQNDTGVIASYAKLWKAHSLLVVPLIVEDRVLGVMRVGSRRRDAFGDEALALVMVVAEEASILVETAMLNRRLAETAEQLAALNRMKDEFVSTVSHEFKTPLTTITGFFSVMLDGETGSLNEQQMKFLQIAKAAAKRLAGLVSDLLDLSRLEGGAKMELGPLDLVEMIGASVENHQPAAAEGSKGLAWTPPARLSPVLGDQRWLGLVVDNLISNALKFTRPGGRVTVAARDKGEFLLVEVSDDGIGIPAEDRDKIFERFYRASNRTEVNAPGTGLGLAIAKEVVAKHGGKIWFDSEIGRGTTFRFVVPVVRKEAGVS